MSASFSKRPTFDDQLERCIARAKAVAASKSFKPILDSLHLLLAAFEEAPEAARTALKRKGYCWDTLKERCPVIPPVENNPVARQPMPLEKNLRKVIYEELLPDADLTEKTAISAETCLAMLLERPSRRLQAFLRHTPEKNTQLAAPYESFREYLLARRQIWRTRCKLCFGDIWSPMQERTFQQQPQKPSEKRLNSLAQLIEKDAHRQSVSHGRSMSLEEALLDHQVSALQKEIVEGIFIQELYGALNPSGSPLSVRQLAQMISPESYPINGWRTREAIVGLIQQGIVELFDPRFENVSLFSLVCLKPEFLSELLSYLDGDSITDDDVAAAKRQLRFPRTWPA